MCCSPAPVDDLGDFNCYRVLHRGEVQRCAKEHTCEHCGRPIHKGERAYKLVALTIDGGAREVVAAYSCCKPL
jgi:hypothetical protein